MIGTLTYVAHVADMYVCADYIRDNLFFSVNEKQKRKLQLTKSQRERIAFQACTKEMNDKLDIDSIVPELNLSFVDSERFSVLKKSSTYRY